MQRSPALQRERAVSPTVGVIMMVAITVVLAALVGAMTTGMLEQSEVEEPSFNTFDQEWVSNGEGNTNNRPYVNITHIGPEPADGSEIYIVDSDGNSIKWEDVWTAGSTVEPGEHVHVDGYGSDAILNHACKGETYRVVKRGSSSSRVLSEVTIPTRATGPAASHC